MYLNAMKQINANTHGIENMLGQLRKEKIFEVINQNHLPDHVSDFPKLYLPNYK